MSADYDLANVRERYLSDAEIVEVRDIIARMRSEYDAAADQRATARLLDRITE